ncbi:hypothetical protein [Virgibacillus dokdonensis]|uniref:HNH endonuclease n=1 Tax=Virgibacillus dokdonensis TaxID=302167 RepID=A0ABU7VK50_9BACI
MWKVSNDINKSYLDIFEDSVIIPIFDIIIEFRYKIEKGIILTSCEKDVWKKTDSFCKKDKRSRDLLEYILQKKFKNESIEDIIFNIVITLKKSEIDDYINLYLYQNREVGKGNYSLIKKEVSPYFKKLFTKFYYSEFFIDDTIWFMLTGGNYKRKSFHQNFKLENDLYVCPYCDIDTTVSTYNNNVEHFLPKSKFPFLAMNPYNLISSCIACNLPQEGKGESTIIPVITPYNAQISQAFSFNVDFSDEIIYVEKNGDKEKDNFIDLLNLTERYADPIVYKSLDKKAASLFSSISNYANASYKEIERYLSEREKTENLILALRSVITKYPDYKRYL